MRSPFRHLVALACCVVTIAAVTGVVYGLRAYAPVVSLGALYVFAVLPVAIVFGLPYSLLVAVGSGLAFNFLFLPPLHTFHLRDSGDWVAIAVYLVTAVVVSELAAGMRRRAAEAEQREREAALLAEISALLLEHAEVQPQLREVSNRVGRVLGSRRAWIELDSLRRPESDESAHDLDIGGRHVGRLFLDADAELRADARGRLLPGIASLLAAAGDRERLARTALEAEALRRSDEAKTAVLRAVSHDLRSPLTAIRAASDGLEHATLALSEDDRAELLATIGAEARRLEWLVRNLLDLSRLEAGAAGARPVLWPVDAIVGGALEELGERGSRVRVRLPANVPPLRVDPTQVGRALVNLVENALRVSDDVEVDVEVAGGDVVVCVRDRGPGLTGDDAERIFEPFERGAAGGRGGSGLGLAIARGFVEANDGRIWAEPRQRGGAVFAFSFPAVREPSPVRG